MVLFWESIWLKCNLVLTESKLAILLRLSSYCSRMRLRSVIWSDHLREKGGLDPVGEKQFITVAKVADFRLARYKNSYSNRLNWLQLFHLITC